MGIIDIKKRPKRQIILKEQQRDSLLRYVVILYKIGVEDKYFFQISIFKT